MNDKFLEELYENVILPCYKGVLDIGKISWKDHGKIELDAWGHYFEDSNGKEYVLVFEDFPGNVFLDDKLTHEIVKIGDECSVKLDVSGSKYIPNVTGYFTLFREKNWPKI